jgi:hypothetical protein
MSSKRVYIALHWMGLCMTRNDPIRLVKRYTVIRRIVTIKHERTFDVMTAQQSLGMKLIQVQSSFRYD